MNRKLVILNVTLAAAVIYTGTRERSRFRTAEAREAAVLARKAAPPPAPRYTPAPSAQPALASGYVDIAQKMLFDKSRNSVVVIDPPAPPPPPKPMPALPLYHGQMDLGDGPIVFLAEGSGAAHKGVRPGDEIGPFKLVEVKGQELAFEWEGKVVRRNADDLRDHGGQSAPVAANRAPAKAAGPPPPRQAPAQLGPGGDAGAGLRACLPNDSYPNGAVVDGYRKIDRQTPFGSYCRWEPAK